MYSVGLVNKLNFEQIYHHKLTQKGTQLENQIKLDLKIIKRLWQTDPFVALGIAFALVFTHLYIWNRNKVI